MYAKCASLVLSAAVAVASAAFATPPVANGHRPGGCDGCDRVTFSWMPGFDDPATPDALDRVGVFRVGLPDARNVLVLVPGTSAGGGYFIPLAEDVVGRTGGAWQVWSVERRENQLEDHSVLDAFKQGAETPQAVFDYYLGWLVDPSITTHFQIIPDASVAFARGWGMNVEIEDLHRVVDAAGARGRRVVLGGHSLGGSIVTAYATWDFGGKAGGKNLDGLVFVDGGSNPIPVSVQQATQELAALDAGSPWLAFGGIPTPFLGLFSATGACAAAYDPDTPSLGYTFSLLPSNLKPPLPPGVVPSNEAQFGFAVSVPSSPPNLIAAQVHAGHIAASGNPRGWERDGAITPIERYAAMLCGQGIVGHDGSAWYHPLRLTIDSGAVAEGNANPAQAVLDVHAVHGHDLPRRLPMYAFGAALGDGGVLAAARILAAQSGIPESLLTLLDRHDAYAHNDPSAASPDNEFLDDLIPFLRGIAHGPRHGGAGQGAP
jgi:hypothetical protein